MGHLGRVGNGAGRFGSRRHAARHAPPRRQIRSVSPSAFPHFLSFTSLVTSPLFCFFLVFKGGGDSNSNSNSKNVLHLPSSALLPSFFLLVSISPFVSLNFHSLPQPPSLFCFRKKRRRIYDLIVVIWRRPWRDHFVWSVGNGPTCKKMRQFTAFLGKTTENSRLKPVEPHSTRWKPVKLGKAQYNPVKAQ